MNKRFMLADQWGNPIPRRKYQTRLLAQGGAPQQVYRCGAPDCGYTGRVEEFIPETTDG